MWVIESILGRIRITQSIVDYDFGWLLVEILEWRRFSNQTCNGLATLAHIATHAICANQNLAPCRSVFENHVSEYQFAKMPIEIIPTTKTALNMRMAGGIGPDTEIVFLQGGPELPFRDELMTVPLSGCNLTDLPFYWPGLIKSYARLPILNPSASASRHVPYRNRT